MVSLPPHSDFEEDFALAPSLEVHASLSVCGNIHDPSVFPFWRDVLRCSSWHLGILSQGLKLDFVGDVLPGPYYEKNNRSARDNPSFVNDSLFSMSSANVLEEVFVKPHCVNPLTVSTRELPSGADKLCLCWDGSRFINPLLKTMGVKLCHFPLAAELLYEGDYQVSMDMKSFYYHLMIFPAH